MWKRNKKDDVDDAFSYIVASEINEKLKNLEPKSVYEFQKRHN